MKRKTLLLIATLVALPGVTYADSPFSSLQSAHEKTTILKDLRKMCTPKGALTDEAWEKKIMASVQRKPQRSIATGSKTSRY
ncbi:hypothetical protein E1630_19265 [Salmonella enterica subsp. enterica serovar Baguida]|nr:hypothetical protein [Salmonella enterica subsp. enterica serovar Baguida]